jgi:hypothetical protein
MSWFGKMILLVTIGLLAASSISPDHQYNAPTRQIHVINGLHFKYGDKAKISHYIQSIVSNNGYLCMGTSESGDLGGKNYFHFLNNASVLTSGFSSLAGAGRTCGIHEPWLLQNKDIIKGLNIIYYINPVYWNTEMNDASLEYSSRYLNYQFASSYKNKSFNSEQYVKEYSTFNKFKHIVSYTIRNARRSYFEDLKETLNPTNWARKTAKVDINKTPLKIDSTSAITNLDSTYNTKKSFVNKEWFRPIDTVSTYRDKELTSFIRNCKSLGVNLTLVMGPYNEKFISNYQPSSLQAYKQTVKKISNIALNEGVQIIDCTDLSNQFGMFDDHQHHSQFAAKKIANKIKLHVLQK